MFPNSFKNISSLLLPYSCIVYRNSWCPIIIIIIITRSRSGTSRGKENSSIRSFAIWTLKGHIWVVYYVYQACVATRTRGLGRGIRIALRAKDANTNYQAINFCLRSYDNSFAPSTVPDWNALPLSIRNETEDAKFKTKLLQLTK